jgi:hypothetical protein
MKIFPILPQKLKTWGGQSITWKVIESHNPVKPLDEKVPIRAYGLKYFCFEDLKKARF